MMTTTLMGCTWQRPQGRRRLMAASAQQRSPMLTTCATGTPRGAATIDAMARHGDLWKWNCNVVKSVCMVFGPPPAGLPSNGGGGGAYCRMWTR
jgi:hypothetical protein